MNDEKDAFDLWWEWADKPVDNKPTIDAAVYDAVMALPPDERRDRAKVNEAVRDGLSALWAEKNSIRWSFSRELERSRTGFTEWPHENQTLTKFRG